MDDHAAARFVSAGWRRPAVALVIVACLLAACGGATPSGSATPPASSKQQLFIFTDKPPAVTEVDPATGTVINQAAIAGFADWTWTWNDDNNFSDGKNLWLGLRNPTTDDVTIIVFSLDRLQVVSQIAMGKDALSMYLGKATKKGILDVGLMASGVVLAVDTKTQKIVNRWTVPVNGDVVCDADVGTLADGTQRFYYPTRKGDTVVMLDPATGRVDKTANEPKNSIPSMLTAAPNGTVWVQESGSNSNAVFDGSTLNLVQNIAVAKGPIVATFSRDGKLGFIGHTAAPVVEVVDVKSLAILQTITVGSFPSKLAVAPNGKSFYALLSGDKNVAVVDTASWAVTSHIPVNGTPSSLYVRSEP